MDMAAASAKRGRCMEGIAALPEDALLHVLSRVGNIKDLFMFAVTCRHYLRRFTGPVFLRGLCPGQGVEHRASLLGFLFQQTTLMRLPSEINMRMMQHTSVCGPTFLPAPGSPLGPPKARALTSLVADNDGTFNYAAPLAARRGIVLMKLVPRTFDATSHLFALSKPITGERHVIPPLDYSSAGYVCGYAIITAADRDHDGKQPPPSSSGRSTFSQLLLITHGKQGFTYYLHSYSAATHSWSATTLCLDDHRFFQVAGRSAVVHRGAAHWLWIGEDGNLLYKLSIDVVGTARVSFTKLAVRVVGGSPHLRITRDDKISVACVYLTDVIVWTQQGEEGGDDTPAAWLRTVIRIPEQNHPLLWQPRGIWFNFDKGSMLMLHRRSGIFVLDLEKKVMEKVMDYILPICYCKPNVAFVPYEMDLVDFLERQLGGICRGSYKIISNTHVIH